MPTKTKAKRQKRPEADRGAPSRPWRRGSPARGEGWEKAGADADKKAGYTAPDGSGLRPFADRSAAAPAQPVVLRLPISTVSGVELQRTAAIASASSYSVFIDVMLEDSIGGCCDIARRRILVNAKRSVKHARQLHARASCPLMLLLSDLPLLHHRDARTPRPD